MQISALFYASHAVPACSGLSMLDECSFPMKWLVMVTEYDHEIKIEYVDEC